MNFDYSLRFEHCYLPGKTGHGKTTVMQRMAIQDFRNGAGITFIDPKGSAVNQLIHYVPSHRKDDCIYIDLDRPIPFKMLNYNGPTERAELVKDLVFLVLKGIPNAPRAESILQRLFYTLLSTTIPVCFLDAYYFLRQVPAPWGCGKRRDEEIIAALPDSVAGLPDLRQLWKDSLKDEEKKPILTRLEPLALNPITSTIFGTPNPELDIARVMNNRKILLVNLGGAGQLAMDYGGLILTKVRQEIFRRYRIKKNDRVPHFLFVDEFHKFTNPEAFEDMLTMARDYRLSLTMANQTLKHLDDRVRASIGIITNYVIFCLNAEDTSFFKQYIPLSEDGKPMLNLASLQRFHALYKLGDKVEYHPTKPLPPNTASCAEYIRKRSAKRYSGQPPKNVSNLKEDEHNCAEEEEPIKPS